MAEWLGGIGNKAQLMPAKPEAGAWPELGKIKWECLNVWTVPTYKMHNIGTVPMFKMHNVGTPKIYDLCF